MCNSHALIIDESGKEYIRSYFEQLYNNRTDDYANGREVRNFFENVYKMHANRLGPNIDSISREEYKTITMQDLTEAEATANQKI